MSYSDPLVDVTSLFLSFLALLDHLNRLGVHHASIAI